MPWDEYRDLSIQVQPSRTALPKYSVTGDILSYRRCPRQYGFFTVRGYKSAHQVQLWFGTIIHQTLDKLHLQYKGLVDPTMQGKVPTEDDVERYFRQVNMSLRARGIRGYNDDNEIHALAILRRFNELEGARLYPHIIDTECAFQTQQETYVLEGVVDVLRDLTHETVPQGYEPVEIWDYKAGYNPSSNRTETRSRLYEDYEFQMLVYAELYRLRTGMYPTRGILYFMNELVQKRGKKSAWVSVPDKQAQQRAMLVFDFTDPKILIRIQEAMAQYGHIVAEIEQRKLTNLWPPSDHPGRDTCATCDKRWDCEHGTTLTPP